MVKILLAVCLLIEGTAFFLYNSILFPISCKRIKKCATYLGAYLCVFVFHSFSSFYSILINIVLFLGANVFILVFLYKLRVVFATVHALLISCISILSEVFVGDAIQQFAKNIWGDIDSINNLLLLSPSVIVFFVLTIIAAIIEKRITQETSPKVEVAIMLVLVSLSFFATVFTYFGIIGTTDITKKDFFLSLNIMIYIALLIGFMIMYFYMCKKEDITSRQKILIQTEKNRVDFLNEIKKRDLEQRLLIHDIKKHFNAIQLMAQRDDAEGINKYILYLTESSAFASPIRYCAHDYLNSILFKYQKEAEQEGIRFTVDTNNVDFSFVADYDLTVIVCNLLDNAFEAARDIENGYISITLTQDVEKNLSIIKIVNSCNKVIKFAQGIPVSSKPETHRHGLGIRSAMQAIDKYQGDINIYLDEENDFHVTVFLKKGEIDEDSDM